MLENPSALTTFHTITCTFITCTFITALAPDVLDVDDDDDVGAGATGTAVGAEGA